MDRFNMNEKHKKIIGRACSKALSEVPEREKKKETLYDIKRNILTIKRLSKISNISNTEIIKLFEDCDFEFWQYNIEAEFLSEKSKKIINNIDKHLSSMSDEERNEFFKKMGFVKKQVTPEGKKLANNITNELKEKLNGMTDEEKEAHLRELGFFQDTMPDNIKERAQINKKVKVKRISNK